MKRIILAGACALLAMACATATERTLRADDPANERAAPGAVPGIAEVLRPDVSALETMSAAPVSSESMPDDYRKELPAPDEDKDVARPDAPTTDAPVYTCPMHPEVRASKPGRCPKCGMELVPAKPPSKEAPQGHEGHSP